MNWTSFNKGYAQSLLQKSAVEPVVPAEPPAPAPAPMDTAPGVPSYEERLTRARKQIQDYLMELLKRTNPLKITTDTVDGNTGYAKGLLDLIYRKANPEKAKGTLLAGWAAAGGLMHSIADKAHAKNIQRTLPPVTMEDAAAIPVEQFQQIVQDELPNVAFQYSISDRPLTNQIGTRVAATLGTDLINPAISPVLLGARTLTNPAYAQERMDAQEEMALIRRDLYPNFTPQMKKFFDMFQTGENSLEPISMFKKTINDRLLGKPWMETPAGDSLKALHGINERWTAPAMAVDLAFDPKGKEEDWHQPNPSVVTGAELGASAGFVGSNAYNTHLEQLEKQKMKAAVDKIRVTKNYAKATGDYSAVAEAAKEVSDMQGGPKTPWYKLKLPLFEKNVVKSTALGGVVGGLAGAAQSALSEPAVANPERQ
jgi:hypothetical protein